MTREESIATIAALDWALSLRHEFQMVNTPVVTRRGMPTQIKATIQERIRELKLSLVPAPDPLPWHTKATEIEPA